MTKEELERGLKDILSGEEYSLTAIKKAVRKAASLEDALASYRELTSQDVDPDLIEWQLYQDCIRSYDFNLECRRELYEAPDVLTGLACTDTDDEYQAYTRLMEKAAENATRHLEGARRWARLTRTQLREI